MGKGGWRSLSSSRTGRLESLSGLGRWGAGRRGRARRWIVGGGRWRWGRAGGVVYRLLGRVD